MPWNQTQWEQSAQRLPKFLSPLVQALGRSERRVGATLYVEGLLMPGQRKSIEPMAERLGVDSQKLQQFIADMGANVYCTVIQEEMEAEKKKESDAQVPSAVAEETGGDAVAEVVDDKKKDDV